MPITISRLRFRAEFSNVDNPKDEGRDRWIGRPNNILISEAARLTGYPGSLLKQGFYYVLERVGMVPNRFVLSFNRHLML